MALAKAVLGGMGRSLARALGCLWGNLSNQTVEQLPKTNRVKQLLLLRPSPLRRGQQMSKIICFHLLLVYIIFSSSVKVQQNQRFTLRYTRVCLESDPWVMPSCVTCR